MPRLATLASERLALPFAWGLNDCASWAADVCLAVRGQDDLAELRVPRCGPVSAGRQILRRGGIPAALARAGLQPVAPALAQRGDLVRLAPPGGGAPVLAVCMGEDALAPGPQGLAAAPMAWAVEGWRL